MEEPKKTNPISLASIIILAGIVFWLVAFAVRLPIFSIFLSVAGVYFFFALWGAMIPLIFIVRRKFNRVHLYEFTYEKSGNFGEGLEIQYKDTTQSDQRHPKKILVRRISMRPHDPLYTRGYKVSYRVPDTICSMVIVSKEGTCNLRLGFPSIEEMNRVYSMLGPLDL